MKNGTNQGVKHFAGYWEKFPERIPSLEIRLGLDAGTFGKSQEGFDAFANAAEAVVKMVKQDTWIMENLFISLKVPTI